MRMYSYAELVALTSYPIQMWFVQQFAACRGDSRIALATLTPTAVTPLPKGEGPGMRARRGVQLNAPTAEPRTENLEP